MPMALGDCGEATRGPNNSGSSINVAFSVDKAFIRALASFQAGKTDEAERAFKELLREAPGHVAGLNLLGILLTQLGRFEEAERTPRVKLRPPTRMLDRTGIAARFYVIYSSTWLISDRESIVAFPIV